MAVTKFEITYLAGNTETVYISVADRAAALKYAEGAIPNPPKPDLSDELPQALRDLNLQEYLEAKQNVEGERIGTVLNYAAFRAAKRQHLPATETFDGFVEAIALADPSGEESEPVTEGESAGPSSES